MNLEISIVASNEDDLANSPLRHSLRVQAHANYRYICSDKAHKDQDLYGGKKTTTASMDHEDAWPEQDPRFAKWDVMRGATIEDLNKLMANRKRGQEAEGCASAGGDPSAMDEDSAPKQDGLEQGTRRGRTHKARTNE